MSFEQSDRTVRLQYNTVTNGYKMTTATGAVPLPTVGIYQLMTPDKGALKRTNYRTFSKSQSSINRLIGE